MADPLPVVRRHVAYVDDHPLTLTGMEHLLGRHHQVSTCSTVEQLLAERRAFDVVLLDLQLRVPSTGRAGTLEGEPAIAALVSRGHRVVLYTNERRPWLLARCLGAGAHGVIHKSEPPEVLMAAIDTVCDGGFVMTLALAGLAEALQSQVEPLTPRQSEVLALRARGLQRKTIARELDISIKTVDKHISDVAGKFRDYLRTHTEAQLAHELGLDSWPP